MTQAVLPQFRQRRCGRGGERHIKRNVEVAAAAVGLYQQQGGGQCVHRIPSAGVGAFQCARQAGVAGTCAEHQLWRNARPRMAGSAHEAYADFTQAVFAAVRDTATPVTYTQDVVEAVWRAVTDLAAPIRIPAGADALALT